MCPTIMVLTDSPHVPTTDTLNGNTCKITENSRNALAQGTWHRELILLRHEVRMAGYGP